METAVSWWLKAPAKVGEIGKRKPSPCLDEWRPSGLSHDAAENKRDTLYILNQG